MAFFDFPALEDVLLPPHDIKMIANTAPIAPSFFTEKLDETNMVAPRK
jgi:hypothetical protein